jgi:predicted TIM-barrel fold metal-dependent hydrolase
MVWSSRVGADLYPPCLAIVQPLTLKLRPISAKAPRPTLAEAGVDRAILIPPSWEGERADYTLEAAAKYPNQFAIMGRLPIDRPEARTMLESWTQQRGMLGVRLTFHHAWDRPWLTDGTADWFWPTAAERLGIPVMLNVPLQPEIGRIAEQHPRLRLIIDHMGRLKGFEDAAQEPHIAATIALARYPSIFVKLSLLPTCSSDAYTYRNMHTYVQRLVEAFGPRRTFWGTDLSVMLSRCSCTYRQAVTMFTEEMPFLSEDDLEWIMGRGLAECLPWPES